VLQPCDAGAVLSSKGEGYKSRNVARNESELQALSGMNLVDITRCPASELLQIHVLTEKLLTPDIRSSPVVASQMYLKKKTLHEKLEPWNVPHFVDTPSQGLACVRIHDLDRNCEGTPGQNVLAIPPFEHKPDFGDRLQYFADDTVFVKLCSLESLPPAPRLSFRLVLESQNERSLIVLR
jgi:hypothetical protein